MLAGQMQTEREVPHLEKGRQETQRGQLGTGQEPAQEQEPEDMLKTLHKGSGKRGKEKRGNEAIS